jgi:putative membrane protein
MSNSQETRPKRNNYRFVPRLSIVAILAWAILLLKYALTGQYYLLIHPNYLILMLLTSIFLLIIGILKTIQLKKVFLQTPNNEQHLTIFPPGIGSSLLLIAAIAGLIIPPTVLSSQTALQRGVTETLPPTRDRPQTFITQTKPEERSLIQWVRTLNAYPEPDAYTGQKAKITGFVINLPELPDNYLLLSRFILTCCAVDAYPVFIPIELPTDTGQYPADTWLEIEGTAIAKTLKIRDRSDKPQEKRRLVVKVSKIKQIPTPKNPYSDR